MNYFDDYFYEPSESEMMIEEIKEALRNEVREDIKKKITSLESTIETLKSDPDYINYKKDSLIFEKRYNELEKEYDEHRRNIEKKIKYNKATEILKGISSTAYVVKYSNSSFIKPKCNKCNDRRKIEYITPRGKKQFEPCECSMVKSRYEVMPAYLFKLKNSRYSERELEAVYMDGDGDEFNCECTIDWMANHTFQRRYNGEKFEDVNSYYTYFVNKEDAEKFCNYLNDKAKWQEKDFANYENIENYVVVEE